MIHRKLQMQFLLILLAGTLVVSFFIFRPFLVPLALAVVSAVVLQPLYKGILSRVGNRGALASLATVLISVVCIVVPLSFLGVQIVNEARQLYNSLADGDRVNLVAATIREAGQKLEVLFPGAEDFFATFSTDIDVYLKQGLEWLINHLGVALSSITTLFLTLFIFFVALYYLLRDGPKVKRAIVELSPLENANDEFVFGRLESAINSVIKGNLTIALIQGALTALGLTIFGVPNSILWGTIAAIAALIPGIGTALVFLPAILYLFVTGSTFAALGLLVWGILAVGLVDNLLGPKLVGSGMRLHPLLVLLSVLGGIPFFGPVGIFLGPLSLSLLFAFFSIYSYLVNPVIHEKSSDQESLPR